jgi:N-ethylmaleimide reductase
MLQLNQYDLAYLHLVDGLGFGYHGLCPPVKALDARRFIHTYA